MTALHPLAGPDPLGRSLIVRPGDAVPEPWHAAPTVEIGAELLADVALLSDITQRIEGWWRDRTRFVVSVAPGADALLDPSVDEWTDNTRAYDIGPGYVRFDQLLRHLVVSNAVDARSRSGEAVFAPVDACVSLGARRSTDETHDVVLADGSAAWCDGGPIGRTGPYGGVAVVHRVAIENGRLDLWGGGGPSAELADDQLAAVAERSASSRVIAPAGSGKTRVLTERARHLVRDWGLAPNTMTLVAFNVRAAAEMRERTTDVSGLRIFTLNALALGIVRLARPRVQTIDERDVRRIIDSLVKLPRQRNQDPTATWIDALGSVRLGLHAPAALERDFAGEVPGFAEFYPKYEQALLDRDAVDFDAQISEAISCLLTKPQVRARARRACRVLLVDEFQDLTPAHLLLIRLLAGPDAAVFGVGDDDQTIYGYNDASPRWLIDYPIYFPGATSHALEVNYRCSREVVAAAASLLSHNDERLEKAIRPSPTRPADSSSLAIEIVDDAVAATTASVTEAIESGLGANSIAVLTRVNSSLLPVQIALHVAGLPVVNAVDASLLERTGIRAALAWLRVATGRVRPGDFGEVARRPSRRLSPRLLEWTGEQRDVDGVIRLAGRMREERDAETLMDLATDVRLLERRHKTGASTAALIGAIRDEIGLGEAVDQLDRSKRTVDRSSQGDDVAALLALARLHPDASDFEAWLRDGLTAPGAPAGQGVVLSTVHRVKGQEWPHVIVHEASIGLFPHRLATDTEEERRLFHVAITRSTQRTTVVASVGSTSPFLDELVHPASATSRAAAAAGKVQRGASPSGRRGSSDSPGRSSAQSSAQSSVQSSVEAALREWRRARARRDGVPAYVIAPDTTLVALAEALPTSAKALRKISGMGPARIERYGDEILAITAASDESVG